jgi:hypothetical protein
MTFHSFIVQALGLKNQLILTSAQAYTFKLLINAIKRFIEDTFQLKIQLKLTNTQTYTD